VGGLDAELAGSLAHLLQALIDWWQTCTQSATPAQWAERCRAMLAALFKPRDDNDRNALAALDQALNDWVRACGEAGFAEAVPLAVARSAWLEALEGPPAGAALSGRGRDVLHAHADAGDPVQGGVPAGHERRRLPAPQPACRL
jgi:exonuclease V gamma subunit